MFGFGQFSQDELTIAIRIAGEVALALANIRLRESFHDLSIRDYLTGLYNHHYMNEMLVKEIAKAKRNGSNIGIIMFDIDHFKRFNDNFGHEAGDAILINLSSILNDVFREGDIICRVEGGKFLVALIDATQELTMERAESLRESVNKLQTKFGHQLLDNITISLGIALYPAHGVTSKALLEAANEALLRAKNEGRDCVCIAKS
jgi:diguanylate cyclase (GGDEF)-like protein